MTSHRSARTLLVALSVALGCSDTIEVVTGGGGSGAGPTTGGGGEGAGVSTGGNGGDPTSSGGASMGGASMGGASMGGAGTGGAGANVCADACAFVSTCGVPLDQCLAYLDCSNPQGECAATCVNEPGVTCDAVFGALQGAPGPLTDCLGACQGGVGGGGAGGGGMGGAGMGGGGVGGGGMGGGGSAMECQQCAQASCGPELQQCFGGASCQSWIQCASTCQDQACLDDCSAMYPAGTALGACLCTDCLSDGCAYTCD